MHYFFAAVPVYYKDMNLCCPVCGKPLIRTGRSFVCENRHTFDCANSGYVNLLASSSGSHGDNKEMTRARTAFLNTGSYRFLRDFLETVFAERNDVFTDLGCGEGYYTKAMPAREKYGFDISKDMINYAAKNDKSTQYAVASIFSLPVFDESCGSVLTCFAPCSEAEIARILTKDGIFVFVSPGPKHLKELKEVLYEQVYENETEERFSSLTLIKEHLLSQPFAAQGDALSNLFMMTPYFYRTSAEGKARLQEIASMSVTAEFLVRIYRK
jgi:23S rRNA (guanine745-N1)-methyltransferase